MHLQDIHLTSIIPVSFTLLQQRLSSNFKIIVQALKTQESLREKHESLAIQNYHLKESVGQLVTKLDTIQSKIAETIQKGSENMTNQTNAIRIQFETMRPYIERMKYNTERVDGIERQFKNIQGTVKEFELIRKELMGLEGRNQLLIDNYRDENTRKTTRLREETTGIQDQMNNLIGQINMLKRKVDSIDLSVILAPKQKGVPALQHSPAPQPSKPTIDDVFKQKVLQKINNINAQLSEFAFEKETADLRTQLKEQKKVLDNNMDMDQYQRMLNFMSEEIKRAGKGRDDQGEDKGEIAEEREEGKEESMKAPQAVGAGVPVQTVVQNSQVNSEDSSVQQHPPKVSSSSEGLLNKESQPKLNQPTRNLTNTSQSDVYLAGLQRQQSKQQDSPNRKLRLTTKVSNKGQVEQVKLFQSINSRIQLLESELQALRNQNIDILRAIQQLKNSEIPIPVGITGHGSMIGDRSQDLHSKSISKQLPATNRSGGTKQGQSTALPAISGPKQKRLKNLDQSVDMFEGVYKRRPSRGNVLSDSKISPSEEPSEQKLHELQKKITEVRNEIHYYFKQLQKSINIRETKEDARKRITEANDKIEQIRQLTNKKMDSEAVKKNLIYLENKVNQVIAIMIANEGEAEATMARRGWACLSCDKNMEKYDGKQGEHKPWNHMQGRNSPPRASGFASLQRNQERYRNMYLNKSEDQTQK